jgi:opacity protein-like surface antigen
MGAPAAHAQDSPWGDLAISVARLDYDLSGVGSAPAFAVRATRDLSEHVRLEYGALFAKPDQQFGPSTLFIPEAQLQYRWNAGRVSPYVGGGIGTALVKSDFDSDWDPALSMAVGTGVSLTDRLGVRGEFRLRGHEWKFTGTSTEISGGLVWRFPSF